MEPTACFSFLYFDFCVVSFISLCLSAAVAMTSLCLKVASKDAAFVAVVMQLGTRHCLTTFDSFVNLGAQKHSQRWGREIEPPRRPLFPYTPSSLPRLCRPGRSARPPLQD